jgi:tetratricopeptide (TPR) repeat protein
MKLRTSSRVEIQCALVAFVMGWSAAAVHAAVVILPNGNRIEGTEIRAQRNGDIILTTAAGQRTFARGTYAKAMADKPAAFDQARSLAGQGKHDEAIAMLEKIAADFRYLDWDNNALIAVAQVQTSRGKHQEAVDVYERLLRQAPELKDDATLAWAYRGAMLQAGMHDKLTPLLDEAIAKGSRSDAARAQVMRGDIRLAQSQVEAAAMDYLRSAILFESEGTVQPEALFKAGEALSRLRDPRAKDMYRRLIEKYPQSTFASDAKTKM